MVWEEAQLVVERVNGVLATEGSILQMAASVAVAAFGKDGGTKARKEFANLLKTLSGGTDASNASKVNLTEKLIEERNRDGRKRHRPGDQSP